MVEGYVVWCYLAPLIRLWQGFPSTGSSLAWSSQIWLQSSMIAGILVQAN